MNAEEGDETRPDHPPVEANEPPPRTPR
jgi:hypothetical protein